MAFCGFFRVIARSDFGDRRVPILVIAMLRNPHAQIEVAESLSSIRIVEQLNHFRWNVPVVIRPNQATRTTFVIQSIETVSLTSGRSFDGFSAGSQEGLQPKLDRMEVEKIDRKIDLAFSDRQKKICGLLIFASHIQKRKWMSILQRARGRILGFGFSRHLASPVVDRNIEDCASRHSRPAWRTPAATEGAGSSPVTERARPYAAMGAKDKRA